MKILLGIDHIIYKTKDSTAYEQSYEPMPAKIVLNTLDSVVMFFNVECLCVSSCQGEKTVCGTGLWEGLLLYMDARPALGSFSPDNCS